MVTKILFFDVDGVLSTYASMLLSEQTDTPYLLDASAVVYFNYILENTQAQVVCCSVWRFHTREFVEKAMSRAGFIGKFHEDWRTEHFEDRDKNVVRGDEVKEWLSRHPEITSYCILDDEGLYGNNLGSYRKGQPIVQCPTAAGLGWVEARMAIALLNGVQHDQDLSYLTSYTKYIPRLCRNNVKTSNLLIPRSDAE